MVFTEEEKHVNIVGRPLQSKSLLVNQAVIHYYDSQCGKMRQTMQARIFELNDEIEDLKKSLKDAQTPLWKRFFMKSKKDTL